MARRLLIALLLAAVPAAPALGEDARTVILREHPASDDHIVTLSDLFEGVEDETQIARAPAPGQALSLDPEYVRREAARAGYRWANAGDLQRVSVTRGSRTIEAAEIAALLQEALYFDTGRSHDVSLSNRALTLHAPLDSQGSPEIVSFESDPRAGLFRAQIAPYPGGEPVLVTGRAQGVVEIPVLTRPLARGEVIAADDINWIRLPADRVRADAILDADGLIGQAAKRSLRAGEALRGYDLAAPTVIARGETVDLVYQVGALTLTARARALEDAGAGQLARFVNLQSNRTVEARADGPGLARVGSYLTASAS